MEIVADGEWTTTVSAELDRPAKLRSISVRACTDSEPSACQPAPDSGVLDLRREGREPSATIAHATKIARA